MGPFSQVPGLAGYQQQVAFNGQQDAGQMMKLSQLMQMAQQQQAMQQAPEDRAMKRRLQEAQMGNYEAEAGERQAKAQKMQEIFKVSQQIASLPPDHPDRGPLVQRYKMLANPEKAFDDGEAMNNPLGKLFKMKAALPPGDPRHAIVDNAIRKESETAKQISPTIHVGDGGGKAPVAYVNDKGVTVWGNLGDARGRPAANFNPELQGQLSQAKKTGATYGEETTKAALDAPRIVQNAETALRLIGELKKHPGFKQAVGASSMLGIQKVPGTDARDFINRLDQLKGGAFLEAFNSLKGGGQITEVEGKKATDAIARMDNATSEPEFTAALNDFESVVTAGASRAKAKARGGAPATEQPAQPSSAPRVGETRKGFVYLGGDPASQSSWKKAAQ